MSNVIVAVFARALVSGQVKTRIAADTGNVCALEIYRQLLHGTLMQLQASGLEGAIAGTSVKCPELGRLATALDIPLLPQGEGDLGERMESVFRLLHRSHQRVIIIGSDCPAMDSDHLKALALQLERSDTVVTPAEDGGYVAIGSGAPALWRKKVFEGVQWSTAETLRQTVSRLHALGVNVTMMDTLWDVDTFEDAQRAGQLGMLDLAFMQ